MNYSGSAHNQNASEAMIDSLQHWWSLAGVDLDYTYEPVALLVEPAAKNAKSEQPVAMVADVSQDVVTEFTQPQSIPGDHQGFIDWLGNSDNLIESQWTKQFVMPTGSLEPEIMIITALPEAEGLNSNNLLSNEGHTLLRNMLSALDCDSEQLYLASLAVGRPVDGRIGEAHYTDLKQRMLHHIGLVRPKRIIIFGDSASNIVFGENLLTARKKKQFINHVSSKTEAIVTFHPRILLQRPEFKAEAWKDLQLLTRIADL